MTPNAKFMSLDISNFYLMTPMKRYEYMHMKLEDIPEEIIVLYKLRDKVDAKGFVYVEILKGMYGLPQAGIIAQELLEKRLNARGYKQSEFTPGLWTHETRNKQGAPTENTLAKVHQFLDYAATNPEAIVTYKKSNMVLAIHSDASYLSEPKARSRAGGHFFLSDDKDDPTNNGAVLN